MYSPLCSEFARRFGAAAAGVVRAPGRVNLIGDHTDYHGLPVFPMAIQREIRLAFRPRADATFRLESAGQFGPRAFALASPIPAYEPGDWGNYAKAAAEALLAVHGPLGGLDALVEGDIPPAAGLSSSSALVVACAIALLEANGIAWEPGALAQLMAEGEKYVGTRGGGMDQTVCLCARPGCALRIDFTPFSYTPVQAPGDWVFVVADSRVVADKSAGARERYNSTRARAHEALRYLPGSPSYPELVRREVDTASIPEDLRGAFEHVVGEARRVDQAVAAMRAGDMARFGALMSASHASLRDGLRVSCPEADRLAAACLEAGAAGARITGAGFGGCVVALVSPGGAPRVIEHLRGAALFAARPSGGASVVRHTR
jgi:galactokinase